MAATIAGELRLGGAATLKAVQRLVQSEHIETVLAPELMRLVSSSEPAVAVPSFLALAKLCGNSDLDLHPPATFNAPEIALAVSDQLTSTDIRMQAAATLALTNMTQQHLALESTILSRVVDAIETSTHEGLQRALLGFIGNASASSGACQTLVNETNCIQVLSELIQADHGEPLRGAAALAIGNVLSTRDVTAQNLLRDVGGLPELVLLLSSTYADETNECSAWAISHGVHQNGLSQDLVGDAGAIGMLLKLALSFDDDVRRNALMALYSSAISHQPNIDRFKKNHGPAIVEDLLNDDVPECREYASLLLKEL
ncbi:Aste57867_7505 [Aphanomyces stellatus]|uniref:Aste57867_7505 protein n=1 Tax=Aphanomyces stellatus TaxID=120398 RepID=A0A485KIE5_9STRA|nr:hypothetical protein As57867_007479 [Aphanomyces stellatus]VFT84414.1 Aste57867_7505 [Aphanomyces stellatus]